MNLPEKGGGGDHHHSRLPTAEKRRVKRLPNITINFQIFFIVIPPFVGESHSSAR